MVLLKLDSSRATVKQLVRCQLVSTIVFANASIAVAVDVTKHSSTNKNTRMSIAE